MVDVSLCWELVLQPNFEDVIGSEGNGIVSAQEEDLADELMRCCDCDEIVTIGTK